MSNDAYRNGLPPRKRKVWPWVVVGLVLVVGCGIGGLFALVGGSAAVVNTAIEQVEAEGIERTHDLKTNSCTADKALGMVTITYTITNKSGQRRAYLPQWDIVASDKTVIGQAGDITQELDPGATLKGKAVGTFAEVPSKFSCKLVSA